MNDLIYRQEVIDAIGDVHPLDYNAIAIRDRIKALPSANQWIPCSERLPQHNIRVLVIDKNNEIDIAELVDYSDINEPDEWWSYEYKVHDPIAWMPLPEPWKGEE